jgi:hypothetical protein
MESEQKAVECQQLCDEAAPFFVAAYDAIVACAQKPANCAAACEFDTPDGGRR